VRSKRPPGVLVSTNDPEVDALRIDVEDVTELAFIDEAFETLYGWVVEEQVTDHEDPATLLGKRAKSGRLGPGEAQRLFHEDVPTGAQSGFRQREVGGGVSSHHDRRNGWIVEDDL
jgi:hypothetical protein